MDQDMKKDTKQNMKKGIKEFLEKILSYREPSSNLYAEFQERRWSPKKSSVELEDLSSKPLEIKSSLFKKLLHVKLYNSTLQNIHNNFLVGDVNQETEDDTKLYKEGRWYECKGVLFGPRFVGILKIGDNSTPVESNKPLITVGISPRKTIMFESIDKKIQVDLFEEIRISHKGQPICFERFKCHKDLFKEFCIESSDLSLREVFPFLRILSNKDNLKDLSLEFLSIKSSLFFGNKSSDCYSLGESLLFYNILFRDERIIGNCEKVLEYVQSVLSENMIPPNMVPSYIFLFDTLVFIMQIASNPRIGPSMDDSFLSRITDPYSSKVDNFSIPQTEYLPVNISIISDNILEMDYEEEDGHSKGFKRIFSIYSKTLGYFNSNLHMFINREDLSRIINSILTSKRFFRHEILGILMHVTCINNFFSKTKKGRNMKESRDILGKIRARSTLEDLKDQIEGSQEEVHTFSKEVHSYGDVNKNILDYDFLGLTQEILKLLQEYLSKLKKAKYNSSDPLLPKFKEVYDLTLRTYKSIRFIGNKFITDMFVYGVLFRINNFNIANIKRLLKFKEFQGEVVGRLKEYREIYDLQRDFCDVVTIDLDPTYNTIEKKVLLNISGVKWIKKGKYIKGMVEAGRGLPEEMFKRYKIYLYEYIKEKNIIKDYEQYFK